MHRKSTKNKKTKTTTVCQPSHEGIYWDLKEFKFMMTKMAADNKEEKFKKIYIIKKNL